MKGSPKLVMSFASLDEAESALDWIGVDFIEGDGAFLGELDRDDRELLDGAVDDPESPEPVRDLARALRTLLDGAADGETAPWRVAFSS